MHRPGTRANRESVVKEYVLFSLRADFPYDAPAPYNVCWYLEHLATRGLVSTTIANHLSSLRTYFSMAGLDTSPLFARHVVNALRAISITVRHVSDPALAITPEVVKGALQHLGVLNQPYHMRLAITWMFNGFLRQSNIAPRTVNSFDPTRHLTRGDASLQQDSIVLALKWSKTMQKSKTPSKILLQPLPGSPLCPVKAYQDLLVVAPTYHPQQPLLQFPDGNSITAPHIAREWTTLLQKARIPIKGNTLHGLQRGGASFSYHDGGATLEDVMAHGSWASSAVRAYLAPHTPRTTSVHRALAALQDRTLAQ